MSSFVLSFSLSLIFWFDFYLLVCLFNLYIEKEDTGLSEWGGEEGLEGFRREKSEIHDWNIFCGKNIFN